MAGEIQYGMTPPLSTELPKDPEKRANDALFAELKAQNTYEHATETQKRYAADCGAAPAAKSSALFPVN